MTGRSGLGNVGDQPLILRDGFLLVKLQANWFFFVSQWELKILRLYLSLGFSCPQHCCFFWIILKIISGNAHIGLPTLCYSYSSQILPEAKAELEMFPPTPSSSFPPVLRGTDLNVVCGQTSLVCILALLYLGRVDLPSLMPSYPLIQVCWWRNE